MYFRIKKVAHLTLVSVVLSLSSLASATPIDPDTPISITNTTFGIGTGFADAANRLDVVFLTSAIPATFNLSAANPHFQFNFGNVTFREECINGPLSGCSTGNGNETQNLGVDAQFVFSGTLPGVTSTALTGAFVGTASDTAVDFYIDFSPVLVSFGSTGVFMLDLSDAYFNQRNQSINIVASFHLLTPDVADTRQVPEPASLAMLALGLAALVGIRRQNRRSRSFWNH